MQALNVGKVVKQIPPLPGNPRNSEGDFLRLNDGRILFAYSRYHGNSNDDGADCDIVGIISDDNGDSFDNRQIFLSRASDFNTNNAMSVSLLRMKNGDLGLFHIVKHGHTDSVWLLRSKNEGNTFYQKIHVLPICDGYYVLNNCRILRTESGRLIAPVSKHRSGLTENGSPHWDGWAEVLFYYSDDDGFSWSEAPDRIVPPFTRSRSGLQEPGVIELPSGSLYAYARTDKYCQYESFSYDNGLHWTVAQPSCFSSPTSPLKIAKSPYSGIYYAVWNPIPYYNGRIVDGSDRTPLVIAQSTDGVSFSEPLILENEPGRGYCYPAIFFADEKTILLSYCSGSKSEGGCLNRTTIRKIEL